MPDPKARFLITAEDRAKRAVRELRGELKDTAKTARGLTSTFGLAFGGAAAIAGITRVAVETDRLRASLETVTGSAANAERAFDFIKTFTAETPFQVNQVSEAFIKLGALGIQPTEELLKSLGNTASALGKPLEQAVEALADATTGEFESLKEFGIKARQEGDKVAFTFRGVTTVVEKNADEITGYLKGIGETDFAGAMERQMDTLGGAFSNLGDAVFNLTDKFARESGFTTAVKTATRAITNLLNEANEGPGVFERFGGGVGVAIARMQVGSASLVEQRKRTIADLEAEESRLQRRLALPPRFIEGETAQLEERLSRVQQKLKVLRDSLEDPEFLRQANELLSARIPDEPAAPTGPLVPLPEGNAPPSGPTAAERRAAAQAARDAAAAEKEYQTALRSLLDELDPVQAETREYLEKVMLLNEAWARGDVGANYESLLERLATDTEALAEEQEKLAQAQERATELIKNLDPGSTYRDQILEVQALREELATIAPALADALADVEFELNDQWEKMREGAKETAEETKDIWQELGPVFSSAFEDAIVEGEKFSDVLKGIEKDLIRIATRKLVTEPLAKAAGNILGGIFGGPNPVLKVPGLPGGQFGGRWMVSGTGGVDSQLASFRVTPGEEITIRTPEQQRSRGGVTVINQINVPQDSHHFRRSAQYTADATIEELQQRGLF